MNTMRISKVRLRLQRGAVATEFAVVSILFLALVIAVIEFARLMVIYVSAVEATRLGARVAAVCSTTDIAKVKARMISRLPLLKPGDITITYPTTGCSAATCDPVTVHIQSFPIKLSIPLAPLTFPMPDFITSVPAESLDSTNNPICT